jgi:hypothetical protein
VRVSVVVPTFNRGPALAETIRRLFASELDGRDDLEILVVDDGSTVPAVESVPATAPTAASPGWPLRWLRQSNAGPAAARNAGFRAGTGELTLFVDDDILVPPDLVRAHVAAHRARPGTVIFGLCPFAPGDPGDRFRRFLDEVLPPGATMADDLALTSTVASGQISVERHQFPQADGVYSSQMTTPAAEEYELAFRLHQRGIPILVASAILATHDQVVDIESYCRQQYKHGVGCGEAAAKRPELLEMTELARIIEATGPARAGESRFARGRMRKALATLPWARASLLRVAQSLEGIPAPAATQFAAYRAAISAHFVAGVREGLSRFAAG